VEQLLAAARHRMQSLAVHRAVFLTGNIGRSPSE
jgi:hypothetical protein